MGGAIGLKLGLSPTFVADDVRVGNAPWGKAPSLLTTKHLELQVALLPLLRRHFELVRLNLVEPVIALERNRDGQLNWELGAAQRAAAATGSQIELRAPLASAPSRSPVASSPIATVPGAPRPG